MIKFSDSPKKSMPQDGIALTRTLVLIAVAIVVVAVGIYALISSNDKGARHQTNIKSGDSSPKTTSQAPSNSLKPIGQAATVSGSTLTLKEFGISVPLNDDLKSLEYSTVSTPQKNTSVYNLRLENYTTLANKCLGAPASTVQSFATITKTNGQYSSSDKDHKITLLKQFANFYIANLGGSQPQEVVCKDQSVQQAYNDLYTKLNNALSSSFSNAQLIQ